MTELAEPTAPLNKRQRQAAKIAEAASGPIGWMLLKILLLAVVDAIALYAAFVLFGQQEWLVLGLVVAVTVLVNYIYFSRKRIPAKYLTPGIIFLIIFQVFTLLYTGYIGFTNYGTGHNGTKDQAISSLLASAQERVEDSATYPVTVVEQFGTYGLLVTDPESGDALLGTAEQPLQEVDAEFEGDQAVAVDGWTTLPLAKVFTLSEELEQLSVPFSDDPNDGSLRAPDGQKGYLYVSTLEYDADADTITDTTTGAVYSDTGQGSFIAEDGAELLPGWQTTVGFDNFVRAVSDENIRGPLISVTIWTFVFALLSVATTFFLGLLLALVFNNTRMRFRNGYRIILILPYAFPAFLSALVWAGMMNESFGFINQVIFGGADIPWLTDPNLAKVSVLLVNLWLGFPYMFLVCMGALQGIPEDVNAVSYTHLTLPTTPYV